MGRLKPGINDIATMRQDLVQQWDFVKNTISPSCVATHSNKKYWWKCEKGHEWQATPNNRANGFGCPYCAGRLPVKGENDFASLYPELVPEWDYSKNKCQPDEISAKSNLKFWWKCEKGHEWQTEPYHRIRGDGCPFCSGHRVWPGFNDLKSQKPSLALEWNYHRNKLLPEEVTVSSAKNVWWVCNRGHEWRTAVLHRSAENGTGCPYCSGRYPIPGETDLATVNPLLAAEWHPTKNDLEPTQIAANSEKKVWWKCPVCNHEWQAKPAARNSTGTGCPNCYRRNRTSFPEQACFFYVKKAYPDAINSYRDIFDNQMELDIFVPSLQCGIEYDGYRHKEKKADEIKYQLCKQKNIRLIRVSEVDRSSDAAILCDAMILVDGVRQNGLETGIIELMQTLGAKEEYPDNISRDRAVIYAQYLTRLRNNSLLEKKPNLAKEWAYDKNNGLKPEMFSWGCSEKVWWKCEKGHEWQASIASRSSGGNGCPICGREKVKRGQRIAKLNGGENSLLKLFPALVKEWNYKRNTLIDIQMMTPHSNEKVWWKCEKGHEWQAIVSSRTYGTGCPYCAGQKAWPGDNDLATQNPDLAKSWNPIKNDGLKPSDVTVGSPKKVWWKCEKGHEWQASIASRSRGNGCPFCSGKKVLTGFNDLAKRRPDLLKEWDYAKNIGVDPTLITEHHAKKVWWKCEKGHEWQATVDSRSSGHNCPYCNGGMKKRVRNADTGEVFESIKAAAASCGLSAEERISLCCRGKIPKAKGFRWEYV